MMGIVEAFLRYKMQHEENLYLSAYDELYILDLSKVIYMQADDHYTDVYYSSGTHFLVPFGLIKVENCIAERPEVSNYLLRMGRKYIVNTRRIFRINTVKELLYLTDDSGNSIPLHISKPVLRNFIDRVRQTVPDIE